MIEFPLLYIWSKFHRKVIVSYYTQSRARSHVVLYNYIGLHGAVKKAAKLTILFTARRLKARPSARATSQLTHLAWENVTTDVTRGGPVHGVLYRRYYIGVHGQCVPSSDRPWTSVHGRLYNIYYTDAPGHPLCRRLAAVQPSR